MTFSPANRGYLAATDESGDQRRGDESTVQALPTTADSCSKSKNPRRSDQRHHAGFRPLSRLIAGSDATVDGNDCK